MILGTYGDNEVVSVYRHDTLSGMGCSRALAHGGCALGNGLAYLRGGGDWSAGLRPGPVSADCTMCVGLTTVLCVDGESGDCASVVVLVCCSCARTEIQKYDIHR